MCDVSSSLVSTPIRLDPPVIGFGNSVGISGDGRTICIGNSISTREDKPNAGSVSIYTYDGTFVEAVQAPNVKAFAYFGQSCQLNYDGNMLFTASKEIKEGDQSPGRVYVYLKLPTGWKWSTTINPPFGNSDFVNGDFGSGLFPGVPAMSGLIEVLVIFCLC